MGKRQKKAWRVASLYLWWTIWKERNRKTFNDVEQPNKAIKPTFKYTFVNWARVYTEDHMLSMSDFVDWLSS